MKKYLILWDLDGTLCPHNEAFHEEAPRAIATAALAAGASLSAADARAFAHAHYPGQKTAIQAFSQHFNIKAETLFQLYYQHLEPAFLSPDNAFIQLMERTKESLCHGVFTQAPALWIHKALTQLNLITFFDQDWLLGYERLNHTRKNSIENYNALATALKSSAYAAERVVIVDDRDFILAQLSTLASLRVCINSTTSSNFKGIHAASSPQAALQYIIEKLDLDC